MERQCRSEVWPAPSGCITWDPWLELRIDLGEGKAAEDLSWVSHGSMCSCMCFAVSRWAAGDGSGGDPIFWAKE